jgi:ribonuclease-3
VNAHSQLNEMLQELFGVQLGEPTDHNYPWLRRRADEVRCEVREAKRLQWLGDAVLHYVVASYLWTTRLDWSKQSLQQLGSYLLSNRHLADVCHRLGLCRYVVLDINQVSSLGLICPISSIKQHGDFLEWIIGTIIDALGQEKGLAATRFFVEKQFFADIRRLNNNPLIAAGHINGYLRELVERKYGCPLRYETGRDTTSNKWHAQCFAGAVALAEGQGKNKRAAEYCAARTALRLLEESYYDK